MTPDIDIDSIQKQAKATKTGNNFDIFTCQTCDPDGVTEYTRGQVNVHLQETHGIDTKTTQAKREMLMHLDGRDWYQSNYRWVFGEVVLINYTRNKRGKAERW